MIEQLVDQATDDAAVLTIDLDRKADVLFGDQHHCGFETKDRTAVPDEFDTAIIPDVPAERIGMKHRLGDIKFGW
jgi:hypothetical protein